MNNYIDITNIDNNQLDIAMYDLFIEKIKKDNNPKIRNCKDICDRLNDLLKALQNYTNEFDKDMTSYTCDNIILNCEFFLNNIKSIKSDLVYWLKEPSITTNELSVEEKIFYLHKEKGMSILQISQQEDLDFKKVRHIIHKEQTRRYLLKTSRLYRALFSAGRITKSDTVALNRTYEVLRRHKFDILINDQNGTFDSYSDEELLSIQGIGPKSLILIRLSQQFLNNIKYKGDE